MLHQAGYDLHSLGSIKKHIQPINILSIPLHTLTVFIYHFSMREEDRETLRRLSETTQARDLVAGDKTELDRVINIKLQAITPAP